MSDISHSLSDQDPTPNQEIRRFQAKIYGRVQGVGFRAFVWDQAHILHLSGSVRNVYYPKRHVDVVAEGPEIELRQLLDLLHVGPAMARVDHVDVTWIHPQGDRDVFRIS